jgi:hypothetical protein
MIKEESGIECKICTHPFTVFQWSSPEQKNWHLSYLRTTQELLLVLHAKSFLRPSDRDP